MLLQIIGPPQRKKNKIKKKAQTPLHPSPPNTYHRCSIAPLLSGHFEMSNTKEII